MQDPKGYKGEEEFYSRQGKLDVKRPIWRRYLWPLIACIALLLAVVFASTTIYLLVNHAPGTTVVTVPQTGTATPMVPTQIPPTLVPTAPPATLTPTPTPTSTKTPVTLKCTPTCDDPILVTIDKITINTTTQSMTWNLTLLNKSGASQNFHFSEFSLQGSSGNKYAGTGDILNGYTEDHSPTYNPGQTVNGTAIFSFVPGSGVAYTLTATMVADSPSNFTTISFDTTTFTF